MVRGAQNVQRCEGWEQGRWPGIREVLCSFLFLMWVFPLDIVHVRGSDTVIMSRLCSSLRSEAQWNHSDSVLWQHNADVSFSSPSEKEMGGKLCALWILFLNAHHFISKHFFKHAIDTILPWDAKFEVLETSSWVRQHKTNYLKRFKHNWFLIT